MIRSCDAFVAVSHMGAIIRLLLTCDFHPEGWPLQHDPPKKKAGKKRCLHAVILIVRVSLNKRPQKKIPVDWNLEYDETSS